MRRLALLNILLNMCLQVMDGILTYYALTKLNYIELNPLVNYLILKMGIGPALIVAKGSGLAILILTFVTISKLGENESCKVIRIFAILMLLINMMYIFVVTTTLINIFISAY